MTSTSTRRTRCRPIDCVAERRAILACTGRGAGPPCLALRDRARAAVVVAPGSIKYVHSVALRRKTTYIDPRVRGRGRGGVLFLLHVLRRVRLTDWAARRPSISEMGCGGRAGRREWANQASCGSTRWASDNAIGCATPYALLARAAVAHRVERCDAHKDGAATIPDTARPVRVAIDVEEQEERAPRHASRRCRPGRQLGVETR